MDSNELIELFYNRTYEKFVNKQILDDKNYIVPCQQLINYVHELIKIPYIDFINYLKQNREKQKIDVSDITQFSSFSVCEIEMCNALLWANNPGCQYVDIGRFFPNKVSHRNDGAYRKYGENHIKASAQLGLTFEYYKYWYLSCIGYIFPDLDSETREKLLARTLTRNMLYQQMLLDILEHDVNPVTYMDPLSEKTVRRRFRNVCFFLRICLKECKNQNINTYNILFEHNNLIAAPLLIIDKRSQLKGKTLSDEDIWVLFESYKNGDKKALNMLIKSHQKLVTDMASLYKMEGVLLEDIIQEGNIGLLTAIERFDHFSYASFSNYAKAWIFQAIYAAMISLPYLVRLSNLQFTLYRKIQKLKDKYEQQNDCQPSIDDIDLGEDIEFERKKHLFQLPSDLRDLTCFVDDYESFEDSTRMPDNGLMAESTRIYVNGLLSHLSKREERILNAFYGLNGTTPETLEQIGSKYGLTRERVRQIKEKSIRKLQIIVGVRKKEKKETEYKLYTKKEKKQQSIKLSEEQIEHRVNIFTQNNTIVQHIIPQLPADNEREKGTSYYSEYLSMREQAQTQQRTNQSLKDSILLVLQQCKMPISLREIVSRVNRSYFVVRTESVEYLLRSMSEVECMTDGRYKLKKEENEILQKEKRTEETDLPIKAKLNNTGTFKYKSSTPLLQLVRKKILTPKENKHCRHKGLYTIGDVKRIIETYHLTRESTRFTQYTINLWFKIVGLLETDIPEKIEEKPKDVQQNQQPINFEEAYYKKYSKIFLEIRQAIVYGKEIIAKPVLLLAVIDGINEGRFIKNHIYLNEWLDTRYKALMCKYGNLKLSTEINMPFWHMKNDGFWHLQFVESQIERRFTPSKNWLRRNVKYAYFDEALWILLENKEWRMKLRDFIVEHKLNPQV